MSDEMLDPRLFQRRPGWKATIVIKYLLTDEEDLSPEQVKEKGQSVATQLEACSLFQADEIIANFRDVTDIDEFNHILDDMYAVCNVYRIWVG